jgi:hypothetical protein
MDRKEIARQLQGVSRPVVVAFAVRCALRALPALGRRRNSGEDAFALWSEEKRAGHILAVLRACNVGLASAADAKVAGIARRAAVHAVHAYTAAAAAAYAAAYAAAHAAADAHAAHDAAAAAVAAENHYTKSEIENDLNLITNSTISANHLLHLPLWKTIPPATWESALTQLKADLRALNAGFEFWITWLDAVLSSQLPTAAHLQAIAEIPESIETQGPAAINAYLLNLQNITAPLNRVRAIFIGDGEAGKTSLVKVLFNEPIQEGIEPMTPGIDIREWPVPDTDIQAHFWDFGGQVMMHATHQLFLRDSCLYVLVMNGRSETNATEQAQYWLEHVTAFGGNSKVLIVGNRLDQAALNLDMGLLSKKYQNIAGYFPLSCTQAQGAYRNHAQAFKNAFCRQLQALETHQVKFTPAQFAVLEDLRQRTPKAAFLSEAEFTALCVAQNIGDAGIQNRAWLLDLLDKLGVIVHFPQLSSLDGYVLNPRWLTYGIYTVMCHKRARITEREIVALLREKQVSDEQGNTLDYPKEKCPFILAAMCQFELCYRLGDKENTLIIPTLLPATQPQYQFDAQDALAFEFDFATFLPRHIAPRLIVQRHREIETQNSAQVVWQSGVLLAPASHQARALLVADYHERKLRLWLSGPDARDYLAVLRDEIWRILSEIRIVVTEMITLPPAARIETPGRLLLSNAPEQAPYQQIMAHARQRAQTYIATSGATYDVATVLKTFVTPAEQARQISQQINNFFGNHANAQFQQEPHMNDKNITVSGGTFHGNFTVADTISNSFNQLAESPAAPDIKSLLEQLLKEISALKQNAPAEQQAAIEGMSTDTQTLITEVGQPEPRKRTLSFSLDGILEAAQKVGTIGQSVLTTAKTLAPLLGLPG